MAVPGPSPRTIAAGASGSAVFRVPASGRNGHSPVESLMWRVAARASTLNLNVILDFGFWSPSERENSRGRASALGAGSEVCSLDVPREDLLARLAARNPALPEDGFHVSAAELTEWSPVVEPPTEEELTPRHPRPD